MSWQSSVGCCRISKEFHSSLTLLVLKVNIHLTVGLDSSRFGPTSSTFDYHNHISSIWPEHFYYRYIPFLSLCKSLSLQWCIGALSILLKLSLADESYQKMCSAELLLNTISLKVWTRTNCPSQDIFSALLLLQLHLLLTPLSAIVNLQNIGTIYTWYSPIDSLNIIASMQIPSTGNNSWELQKLIQTLFKKSGKLVWCNLIFLVCCAN